MATCIAAPPTLTLAEGREQLRALGTTVLWHGAHGVLFEAV